MTNKEDIEKQKQILMDLTNRQAEIKEEISALKASNKGMSDQYIYWTDINVRESAADLLVLKEQKETYKCTSRNGLLTIGKNNLSKDLILFTR